MAATVAVDDSGGVPGKQLGAKRHPNNDLGVQGANRTPEQQLRVDGGAAEEPDPHPGNVPEQRVVGLAHEGQQDGQHNGDGHGGDSQDERPAHALDDQDIKDVGPKSAPVELRVGGHRLDGQTPGRGGCGGTNPPPRVLDWNCIDQDNIVRRGRAMGCARELRASWRSTAAPVGFRTDFGGEAVRCSRWSGSACRCRLR